MKINVDYREKYKGVVGACTSCAHIRTQKGDTLQDIEYVDYDGGKHAKCLLPGGCVASIVIHDSPNLDMPINKCWEPRRDDN